MTNALVSCTAFREAAAARGMLPSSISPQKRHLIASALISSAQNGHFLVAAVFISPPMA
jgi:hypothetical protein